MEQSAGVSAEPDSGSSALEVENTAAAHPDAEAVRNAMSDVTIPFQENRGQWGSQVGYRADTLEGTLWVTRDGQLVHAFPGRPLVATQTQQTLRSRVNPATRMRQPPVRGAGWSVVETFVEGHLDAPRGLEPSVTNVSYFVGDEDTWAPQVVTFAALELGEVWPGIWVRLRARGDNVEKFFHVATHADASRIAMAVHGARRLRLARNGSLVVTTGNGDIAFSPPTAYQDIDGVRRSVEVAYSLTTAGYRFRLGDYSHEHELVIDPILQSTYLGGSATETRNLEIAFNAAGEALMIGNSTSTNFPGTAGGAQPNNAGSEDMVVMRIRGNLTAVLQSTYVGGSSDDYINSLLLAASGEVVIGGWTLSSNLPSRAGSAQAALGGGADGFITRLSSTLTSVLRTTYFGGSAWDSIQSIEVNPAGEIVAFGSTQSGDLPGAAGGAQPNGAGTWDMMIGRFNSTLTSRMQSTYLGGSQVEDAYSGGFSASGDTLLVGVTASGNFPGTTGGAQPSIAGGADLVVARLNSSLTSLLQSTYLGGSGSEEADVNMLIAVSGDVVVGCGTASGDFPGTSGGAQPSYAGGTRDFALARLNGGLTALLQSTYLGGSGAELYGIRNLALASNGDIFAIGTSTSLNFPATTNGAQAVGGSDADFVVARLNGTVTTLLQSTYLGGTGVDTAGAGLALNAAGDVFVSGWTESSNFPGTSGGAQPSYGGGTNDLIIVSLTGGLTGCTSSAECRTNPGGGVIFAGRPTCQIATRQCIACTVNSDCDDGNACTNDICTVGPGTCSYTNRAAGFECRASAGGCDVAENCPGTGAQCPADSKRALGFSCRAAAGVCDAAETCDGVGNSCPVDAFQPSAITCRASAGACDVAETCTGGSVSCPSDSKQAAGFSCRAASGACDVAETCDGVANTCPVDAFQSSATICRASAGLCDVAEVCSGASSTCPADSKRASGFSCRVSAGVCDVSEVCDGAANTCPTDGFLSSSTTCRASAGLCDVAEVCSGASSTCPADTKLSAGTSCRVAAGVCDVVEVCDGAANSCPADAFAPNSTTCRVAAGLCDVAEVCSGASSTCPADTKLSAGTSCRVAAGICDVAEVCDGVANTCPADGFLSSSTTCRASAGLCDVAEACSGSSSSCPSDNKVAQGSMCRASAGVCDVAEVCDGLVNACPADGFAASVVICRVATGSCDLAENCSGASALCPSDGFALSGTSCPAGQCNGANMCVLSCGNSVCESGESCATCAADCGICACTAPLDCPDDGNPCTVAQCNSYECRYVAGNAGAVCRVAAHTCDVEETCTGVDVACANDEFAAIGATCPSGRCDAAHQCRADFCDTALDCADDENPCTTSACSNHTCQQVAGSRGRECRARVGLCDVAEQCDGVQSDCPNDAFQASGAVCSGGACDGNNRCVSVCDASRCPEDNDPCTVPACVGNGVCGDAPAARGTYCLLGDFHGVCDASGQCSTIVDANLVPCEIAADCPDDGNPCTSAACVEGLCEYRAGGEGLVCRSGNSECDVTETCDGLMVTCPGNGFAATDVRCATGVCGGNACVECLTASHCDDANPCTIDLCDASRCMHPEAEAGNSCGNGVVCSGGRCTGCERNSQCGDNNDCTQDLCISGECGHVAYDAGHTCATGVCTTTGVLTCVGCTSSDDCETSFVCRANRCDLDLDADPDHDGLINQRECRMPPDCRDTDGDGTPDYLDPDDDGDGVPTAVEEADATRYGEDFDLDGRPNRIDLDADSDNIPDGLDGTERSSTGRPNYLNPDEHAQRGGLSGGGACGSCRVGSRRDLALPTLGAVVTLAWLITRRRRRIAQR